MSLLKTDYEHSKKAQYIDKVKAQALDNVLKEKAFYSKKLGIALKAVSFKDNNASPQHDVEIIEVRGIRSNLSKAAYPSNKQPSFEKVTYKAKVSVSFKVE